MAHQNSVKSPSPFVYRHTALWAPLGCAGLAVVLFLLAATADSVFHFVVLLAASVAVGWAATLFHETVELRIDPMEGEVHWVRQGFERMRIVKIGRVFKLEMLTSVWLERFGALNGSNYRVVLRLGQEWLPLSRSFSNDGSPEALHLRLLTWLKEQGIEVSTGKGALYLD